MNNSIRMASRTGINTGIFFIQIHRCTMVIIKLEDTFQQIPVGIRCHHQVFINGILPLHNSISSICRQFRKVDKSNPLIAWHVSRHFSDRNCQSNISRLIDKFNGFVGTIFNNKFLETVFLESNLRSINRTRTRNFTFFDNDFFYSKATKASSSVNIKFARPAIIAMIIDSRLKCSSKFEFIFEVNMILVRNTNGITGIRLVERH